MKLSADPRNPAQYFAACGVFELASMRDQSLTSHWSDSGLIIEPWSDDDLGGLISDFAHANLIPADDWTGEDTIHPYAITNDVTNLHIQMDWWERRDGSGNSFWKCFGGKQKSTDAAKLLSACHTLADQITPDKLFQLSLPLTGRLGFDPRSAWNPIDTGFSPNDLSTALKSVPTYAFTELLCAVALQRWPFQPDRGTCHYHLWSQPLPLSVARIHATAGQGPAYAFSRIKRGQGISCFTYSRPVRASQENRS
jgi:hypothetical protein